MKSTCLRSCLVRLVHLVPFALLVACDKGKAPVTNAVSADASPAASVAAPAAPVAKYAIDRRTFNETAFRLNIPVYWGADKNGDGAVDPGEVKSLLFYPTESTWVENGKFSAAFDRAFAEIKAAAAAPPPADPRRKLERDELAQGATTLVFSDLTRATDEDKTLVRHMLKVAKLIDELYATQTGAAALASTIPADDPSATAIFRRNWGPRCVAPRTENDPACSALPGAPRAIVSAYPADIQKDKAFCAVLEKAPRSNKLLDPFTVVASQKGTTYSVVPYTTAYKDQMAAISAELKAAAADVKDANEAPLKAYLLAASKSFTTNDWLPADEAWAKMNAANSKWYLRVAPDEVYWDPCAHKAGFHLAFAKINPDSLTWQAKLNPVQAEMEETLAAHIGAPYKPRKVTFHLPDFIDVVFNAGDSRHPHGGTIGQSLPNWGKVAAEGRGRTVAMSNLYTDPDSLASRRAQAESLLSKGAMSFYAGTAQAGLLATILHEATHNLGPAHEYKYNGKTDAEAFGGGMSAMLEELKAQTGALYYVEFLRKKGIISDEQAKQTYTDCVVWAFGHISRGMYTESGARKAYSQLAAVQVGFLMDEGALVWDKDALAANGTDKGAFVLDFAKLVPAIDKMMKVVGGIKARNDDKGALDLAAKYVDGKTVPQATITERELRVPKVSFVYGIEM